MNEGGTKTDSMRNSKAKRKTRRKTKGTERIENWKGHQRDFVEEKTNGKDRRETGRWKRRLVPTPRGVDTYSSQQESDRSG